MKIIISYILTVISSVLSHSWIYPTVFPNEDKPMCDPTAETPAKIFSWHAHVMFFTNNPASLKKALNSVRI